MPSFRTFWTPVRYLDDEMLKEAVWRDSKNISILVELTVCQKNVTNALNSVEVILNKKAVLSQKWPRIAPYIGLHGAMKIFMTPWLRPRLLFPTFFMDFCFDPPYECSFKIWSPYTIALPVPEIIGGTQK